MISINSLKDSAEETIEGLKVFLALDDTGFVHNDVAHWMPLPEPPKGE